jgi:hypothetical protein
VRSRSPVTVAGPPRTRTGFLHCRSPGMLPYRRGARQRGWPSHPMCLPYDLRDDDA